jgi:hypothetical protein
MPKALKENLSPLRASPEKHCSSGHRHCEADDSDSNEIFFSKLILNVLQTFGQTYSEYHLLMSLMSETLLEGPWFTELSKQMEETRKKDNMSYGGVSLMRQIVGRNEVVAMVRRIQRAHPHLKAKPKVRATTKTLADLLDLNELEMLMLDSACRYTDMSYSLTQVVDNLHMCFSTPASLIAGMYKKSQRDAQKALDGMLFHAGILSKDGTSPDGLWGLQGDLEDVFSDRHMKIEDIDRTMFPHMLKTDLNLDDYGHLETESGRAIDIIEKNMLQPGKKQPKREPVNVMFWGVAGTGKTELAIAIAKQRGWNLKVIGDVAADNRRRTRARTASPRSSWRRRFSATSPRPCCCSTRWRTCSRRTRTPSSRRRSSTASSRPPTFPSSGRPTPSASGSAGASPHGL